jgi:hypothetical protein
VVRVQQWQRREYPISNAQCPTPKWKKVIHAYGLRFTFHASRFTDHALRITNRTHIAQPDLKPSPINTQKKIPQIAFFLLTFIPKYGIISRSRMEDAN